MSNNRTLHNLLVLCLSGGCFAGALSARGGEDWDRLTPEKLKTPVIVDLTRNPCQPAVPESTQALQTTRGKDDLAPAIQAALSGRLRSVVRGGGQPVVLIGTRLIRPGDEILLDAEPRSASATSWKLRLKDVLSDRLVWMMETNGGGLKEITTWLDLFLRGT